MNWLSGRPVIQTVALAYVECNVPFLEPLKSVYLYLQDFCLQTFSISSTWSPHTLTVASNSFVIRLFFQQICNRLWEQPKISQRPQSWSLAFKSIKSKLCWQGFVYKSNSSTVCDHLLVIRVTTRPVTVCCFLVVSACGLEDCETLLLRLWWTSLLSKHETRHPEQLLKLTSSQSLHSQTGQHTSSPLLTWSGDFVDIISCWIYDDSHATSSVQMMYKKL